MKTKKNFIELLLLAGVILSFVGMIFFLREVQDILIKVGGFILSLNIFTITIFWLLKGEVLPYNRRGMIYLLLKGYKYLLFILGIYLLFLVMDLEYKWEVEPAETVAHFSTFSRNAKTGTAYLLGFWGILFSILGVLFEIFQIRKEEK